MTEMMMTEVPAGALAFARTAASTRLHLLECPHLVGRAWHDATDAELDTFEVCQWSQDQLSGHGRSHPSSLEDAMREQGTPADAVCLIKEHLRFVTYDEIWLPYSRSYVALGLEGRAVAAFGKSYVLVGGRRIDLPGYVAGKRTGHRTPRSHGEVCSCCFVARSLTGACDCD